MKIVNKIELLERLQRRVEGHLDEVIKVYQILPENILLQPSRTGGWSIAQCLEHLNSYGRYYLPEIESRLKKASAQPAVGTFTSTWLGSYFTKMMEPQSGNKRYKAFKGHIPSTDLNAFAVVAEFIEQQEILLVYLRKSKEYDLNQVHISISIAKWIRLRVGDVFQFLVAHNERHLQQASRNLTGKTEANLVETS